MTPAPIAPADLNLNPLSQTQTRNLLLGIGCVLIVGGTAVCAYMLNGWSLSDALYMVILTVFTVGYDEVRPLDTTALRLITMSLIVLGCTGMIFLTGVLVQAISFREFESVLGNKRMNRQIEEMKGHVIICGFGRIGNMLAKELRAGKARFVILEPNAQRFTEAREAGYPCLQADATEEDSLRRAGILRARALASVVPSDAVNVFITLNARSLNQSLQIVARGESPATERKLLQAGANAVVLPTHIGAEQVASIILYPGITRLLDQTDGRARMEQDLRALGLEIEVVTAAEGSAFVGLTVEEIEQQSRGSFFIVAVERPGSTAVEQPRADTRIHAGDGVTILGRNARADLLARFGTPA
jgi:trk system potassium uptake protein TrkA/voltage-gated potassium channel